MNRPVAEIDAESVRRFWEERARRFEDQDLVNLSNLEADRDLAIQKHAQEREVLEDYVRPRADDVLLDLGAGHGAWAANFAARVAHIDCVEYSEGMAAIAQAHLKSLNIQNVRVHCVAAQDFESKRTYDTILISGLLIYLTDHEIAKLLKHMRAYAQPAAKVVLRDGTARDSTFTIQDKYSDELDALYSAHYRTTDEYIACFRRAGFSVVRHQDMFPEGSTLNKRKETILRVYEFRRTDSDG